METSASFEARSAPSSYPTSNQSDVCAPLATAADVRGLVEVPPRSFSAETSIERMACGARGTGSSVRAIVLT
jgi:hypothetical protein